MQLNMKPAKMARRTVRFIDVDAKQPSTVGNGIEDLYEDRLDVIIARGAFSPEFYRKQGVCLIVTIRGGHGHGPTKRCRSRMCNFWVPTRLPLPPTAPPRRFS